MNIFVKTHKNRTIQLDINPSEKLERIKIKVFEFNKKTHLIYGGEILDISKSAMDYNIPADSTIHLSICI